MNEALELPVTEVKGIGTQIAKNLQEMNIYTINDLLEYFPFRYEDYRMKDLADISHEERVTVEGVIHSEPIIRFYGKKKSRLELRVLVGNYLIKAILFNQAYLKSKLHLNDTVTLTGKWDKHKLTITVSQLHIGQKVTSNELMPVYSVKGKVNPKAMGKFVSLAFDQYKDHIVENLPLELVEKYRLMGKQEALLQLHYPNDPILFKQARRRMIYEEFLYFQLKMQALRKFERENSNGKSIHYDLPRLKELIKSLPFELTNAQKRVVNEILKDLKSPFRMNRLLQGDVGSGKTAVASLAIFASFTAGFQSALMVPTEILAEQHFQGIKALLEPFGVSCELLTSSIKGKKKQEILERLKNNEIHLLIGTHALIQDYVIFHSLGLVITDEQHRFGVEQRRILREKGYAPDVLFMTATPIPRTLAITAFGEMDVSIIDEMPQGRQTIETHWVKQQMISQVLEKVQQELNKGHQAYIICPLIEDSDKLDVQNAIDVYAQLQTYFHGKYQVGLMHGRLHAKEKEEVMHLFSQNKIQVLVSTTVVEVGVNVPNATMMVIYDAERFGLAQLHQLRGRVGRGSAKSYCILLADPKSDIGKERMRIMTETTNGFELSEKDLELRGPGEFFGKRQSGIPEFKIADMVTDFKALEVARDDAAKLVNDPAFFKEDQYTHLRNYLLKNDVLQGEKLD